MHEETAVFISDVHSNLEALDAVLEAADGLGVYCLGDIVGYGASPNEVIARLRESSATCILGNHDLAAVTGEVSGFNPRAAMAVLWTARHLSQDGKRFLNGLPRRTSVVMGGRRVLMVHGSPDDPMWEYVFEETHRDLFGYYLRREGADVVALGHTHVPFAWRGEEGIVFNPGSVGQPRDGDARASYALLTVARDGSVTVEPRRVVYDVRAAAEKITSSGLPPSLASRLATGD